jgi:hypothetical protein
MPREIRPSKRVPWVPRRNIIIQTLRVMYDSHPHQPLLETFN